MTKIVSTLPTQLAIALANAGAKGCELDPDVDWDAAVSMLNYLFAPNPRHEIAELASARGVMRNWGKRPERLASYATSSLQQAYRDNKPIRFGEGRE